MKHMPKTRRTWEKHPIWKTQWSATHSYCRGEKWITPLATPFPYIIHVMTAFIYDMLHARGRWRTDADGVARIPSRGWQENLRWSAVTSSDSMKLLSHGNPAMRHNIMNEMFFYVNPLHIQEHTTQQFFWSGDTTLISRCKQEKDAKQNGNATWVVGCRHVGRLPFQLINMWTSLRLWDSGRILRNTIWISTEKWRYNFIKFWYVIISFKISEDQHYQEDGRIIDWILR